MNGMVKRILSMVMAVVMVISMVPTNAFAETSSDTTGTFGGFQLTGFAAAPRAANEIVLKGGEEYHLKTDTDYVFYFYAYDWTPDILIDAMVGYSANLGVVVRSSVVEPTVLATISHNEHNPYYYYKVEAKTISEARERKVYSNLGDANTEPESASFTIKLEQETKYTVSFNPNGGTGTISAQTANADNSFTITLPDSTGFNSPVEGAAFRGWKVNNEGETLNAGDPYTPTDNVTLYAVWNVITLTLDTTDGEALDPVLFANKGSQLSYVLPTPSRSGYTFRGWTDDPSKAGVVPHGGTVPDDLIDAGTMYHFLTDTTLYAVWEAPEIAVPKENFQVYELNPGQTYQFYMYAQESEQYNHPTLRKFNDQEYEINEAQNYITLVSKVFENEVHPLDGSLKKCLVTVKASDSNITANDKYVCVGSGWGSVNSSIKASTSAGVHFAVLPAPVSAKVTFAPNGGNGAASDVTINSVGGALKTRDVIELPESGDIGMSAIDGTKGFVGWSTNPTAAPGSNEIHSAGSKFKVEAEETVFYAIWASSQYTVTLHANDGTESMRKVPSTTVPYRGKATANLSDGSFTAPATDIEFQGWVDKDGNPVELQDGILTDISEDMDLYATWDGARVTFSVAPYGQVTPDTVWVKKGNTTTLPNSAQVSPSKEIDFQWYDGVKLYYPVDVVTIKSDTEFVAIWNEDVNVTFDPMLASEEKIEVTAKAGEPLKTPNAYRFHKEGYELKGWTMTNGGTTPDYAPGAPIIATSGAKYYAVWKKVDAKWLGDIEGVVREGNAYYVTIRRGETITFDMDFDDAHQTVLNGKDVFDNKKPARKGDFITIVSIENNNKRFTIRGDKPSGEFREQFGSYYGQLAADQDKATCYAFIKVVEDEEVDNTAFKLSFEGGEGAVGKVAPIYGSYEDVTLPACGYTNGYRLFTGWQTADGNHVGNAGDKIYLGKNTTLFAEWAELKDSGVTIKFDINEGAIGKPPANIETTPKASITLPKESGFYRDGYKFIGWSVKQNFNNVDYVSGGTQYVGRYTETYVVPNDQKEITMYACWSAKTEDITAALNYNLTIAIRADGTVPAEPAYWTGADYYYIMNGVQTDLRKYLTDLKLTAGVAKVQPLLNFTTQELLDGKYEDGHVLIPSLLSNRRGWKDGNGIYHIKGWSDDDDKTYTTFNPETQDIMFYVIKFEEANNQWHIDGAIVDKQTLVLIYEPNGATQGLVPSSQLFKRSDWSQNFEKDFYEYNEDTTVEGPRNKLQPNSDLVYPGHHFIGWATADTVEFDENGEPLNGVRFFKENDPINLTMNTIMEDDGYKKDENGKIIYNNTTTLYAIWEPNTIGVEKEIVSITGANGTVEYTGQKVLPGETINYQIKVINNSTVDVSHVELTDALIGTNWTDKPNTDVIPAKPENGDANFLTWTGSYTVPLDYAESKVPNTAYANALDPTGTPLYGNDSAEAEINTSTPDPKLTVEKRVSAINDGKTTTTYDKGATVPAVKVGDIITYTITVKNEGNVDLTNVVVEDTLSDAAAGKSVNGSLSIGDLNAGANKEITVTLTVTEDMLVKAGTVVNKPITNKAKAEGKDPDGNNVESNEPSVSTPTAGIKVEKTIVNNQSSYASGAEVTYSIVVTNIGSTKLTDVELVDVMTGDGARNVTFYNGSTPIEDPAPFDLNAGASETFTAKYQVTDADTVAAAANKSLEINNNATATGTVEGTNDKVTDSADVDFTPTPADPKFEVTKKMTSINDGAKDKDVADAADDKINYTVTIKNTGNVDLTVASVVDTLVKTVSVDDVKVDGVASNVIPVGKSAEITYTYTITQNDLNNDPDGIRIVEDAKAQTAPNTKRYKINNQVTVNAQPTAGGITLVEQVATAEAPMERRVGLELVKDITSTNDVKKAGDQVAYLVTIKNTGNVTLEHISFKDSLAKIVDDNLAGIKLDDLNGGIAAANPATKDKQAEIATLAPGKSATIAYTYTATQADIDNGKIENTATAKAKNPLDATNPLESQDSEEVTTKTKPKIIRNPKLEVEKNSYSDPDHTVDMKTAKANDTVYYEITVKNTGNVTIENIVMKDFLKGFTPEDPNAWAAKFTLVPQGGAGDSAKTFYGTFNVTQSVVNSGKTTLESVTGSYPNANITGTGADIVNNSIFNLVTATGKDPIDQTDVTGYDKDDVALPNQKADLSVTKTAKLIMKSTNKDPNRAEVGDTIEYTITVKNTGNTTLSNVTLEDKMADLVAESQSVTIGGKTGYAAWDAAAAKWTLYTDDTCQDVLRLEPNESVSVNASYVAKQSDLDKEGGIINTVTADSDETDPETAEVDTDVISRKHGVGVNKSSQIIKTGANTMAGKAEVGDQIFYTIVITNTGNVTWQEIDLKDSMDDMDEYNKARTLHKLVPAESGDHEFSVKGVATKFSEQAWDFSGVTLAPGAEYTVYAYYDVQQIDIDLVDKENNDLPIINTAAVTAKDAVAKKLEADNPNPSEEIQKQIDEHTAEDANDDTVDTYYDLRIGVQKTAEISRGGEKQPAGTKVVKDDVVEYTITVTNNSNVTMHNVTLTDDMAGLDAETVNGIKVMKEKVDTGKTADAIWDPEAKVWTLMVAGSTNEKLALAPGESASVTASYTVTEKDMYDEADVAIKDPIRNYVEAKGYGPKEDFVTNSAAVVVTPEPAAHDLRIRKTSVLDKGSSNTNTSTAEAGDVVYYTIKLSNEGNATITDIHLTDELQGLLFGEQTGKLTYQDVDDWTKAEGFDLAPGESKTFHAYFKVTQAVIDAGGTTVGQGAAAEFTPDAVYNIVTAIGKDDKHDPIEVWDTDPVVLLAQNPMLNVYKSSELKLAGAHTNTVKAEVDDVVYYTIKVKNTGNVTLTNVTVKDPMADLITSGDVTSANEKVTVDNAGVANWDAATKTWTLVATELLPKEEKIIHAAYVVTQADIDNPAPIKNSVHAEGKTKDGAKVEDDNDDSVDTMPGTHGMLVTKTGTLDKTEGRKTEADLAEVGNKIHYTIELKNTGNVTLFDVTLTDKMENLVAKTETGIKVMKEKVDTGKTADAIWDPAAKVWTFMVAGSTNEKLALLPDESVSVTASYIVTQNDIDHPVEGMILNRADGKATDTARHDVTDNDDSKVPVIVRNPAMQVTKVSTLYDASGNVKNSGRAGVGDKIEYTVTVENTGNIPLTGVTLTDLLDDENGQTDLMTHANVAFTDHAGKVITKKTEWQTSFDLSVDAPDNVKIFVATYTVQQSDVDRGGTIRNDVTAKCPSENLEESAYAEDSLVTRAASLNVEKWVSKVSTVSGDFTLADRGTEKVPAVQKGETVTFTITVENTGNVTLKNVNVTDTLTYVKDGTTVQLLSIESNGAALADDAYEQDGAKVTVYTMEPKQVVTITASLKIEDDTLLDRTSFRNRAEVLAANPIVPGTNLTGDSSVVVKTRDLTIDKHVQGTKQNSYGKDKTVVYEIVVSNNGTADLEKVVVTDEIDATRAVTFQSAKNNEYTVSDDGKTVTIPKLSTVGDGRTVTVYAEYTVTEEDMIEAAKPNVPADSTYIIHNTATAVVDDGPNREIEKSDDEDITPEKADPKLLVTKTVDKTNPVKVDEVVTYTVTVKNTGNVTLKNISFKDSLAKIMDGKLTGIELPDTLPTSWRMHAGELIIDELVPQQETSITYTYTVTQGDIDSGAVIHNVATATAENPVTKDPENPVTDDDDKDVTPEDKKPALTIDKTANVQVVKPGDTIEYTITVENTGNVTLKDIEVTDALENVAAGTKVDFTDLGGCKKQGDTLIIETLNVGSVVTIKAELEVTEQMLNAGEAIENTATATDPDEDITEEKTVIVDVANVEIDKVPSENSYPAVVGEKVDYTITVTNTGSTVLTGLKVTDDMGDRTIEFQTGRGYTVSTDKASATVARLNVGASISLTAQYTITADDVQEAEAAASGNINVKNTATVTVPDPDGNDLTDSSDADITIEKLIVDMTLTKEAVNKDVTKAGDVVTYTVTVTNTGNVTLKNVVLDDSLVDAADRTIAELLPGAANAVTFTYDYTATQADIDKGTIYNKITADAQDPRYPDDDTQTVHREDDVTITTPVNPFTPDNPDPDIPEIIRKPDIEVVKTAVNKDVTKAGDVVDYTVKVTNTGNVTLTDIAFTDTLVSAANKTIAKLAPGEFETITYKYTATQDDIDAGLIENTASAEGKDPDGNKVKDEDEEIITTPEDPFTPNNPDPKIPEIIRKPEIKVEKEAVNKDVTKAGDVVDYTVKVTNTGNVTLTDIAFTDTLVSAANKTIAKLAPGEFETITYKYTATQDDIDKGLIENTAAAEGKDPDGNKVTDDDKVEIKEPENPYTPENPDPKIPEIIRKPAIEITKVAANGLYTEGDTVEYTITVKNIGNVTLKNVNVTDAKTGLNKLIPTMGLGETVEFTTTYVVKRQDIKKGILENTAVARGEDPTGKKVTDDDTETIGTEDPTNPTDPKNPDKPVLYTAEIMVAKSVPASQYTVGQTVPYTIKVTNVGIVALKDVEIVDDMTGLHEIIPSLAVGESVELVTKYVVKTTDVSKTKLTNTATAEGTDPNGYKVKDEDSCSIVPKKDTPKLPQTGQLWWPVSPMTVVGLGFVVLGMVRRKKSEEDA